MTKEYAQYLKSKTMTEKNQETEEETREESGFKTCTMLCCKLTNF